MSPYALGRRSGPLRGVRVVEIAGAGPGPHAAMTLADLGADVLRVDRPGTGWSPDEAGVDLLARGRPSVVLDLKKPAAVEAVLALVERADALVEGMRPGVMERLGLGPDECVARNPALVYARMTGWGQDGPWARVAGHDLTYIAVAGVLHGLGQQPDRPHFPSNLVGDFGAGSLYLVVGLLAALIEARASGRGQVVDAAIVDGAAHLNAMHAGFLAGGLATEKRASGTLDGGVPYYGVYETADGRHMAVGSLEPDFYQRLLDGLGLDADVPDRADPTSHEALRERIAARFRQRTQAHWCEVFDGTDACVAPVLPPTEAARHPQLRARRTYVEHEGVLQPAPAPRFSRTPGALTTGPSAPGAHTRDALTAWGVSNVDELILSGAAHQA